MSFNEIIGQQEVKKLLKNTLIKQRIASAYLFVGPSGIGKATAAFNFAKAMNCSLHKADSCPKVHSEEICSSCKKIDAFSHPDVTVLFPVPKKFREENRRNELQQANKIHSYRKTEIITIDDVRDIAEILLMKPFEAKRRVIIIIDGETMNTEAQNAFLKILEEPPLDTTIILTSSQPERLFLTILSRCQKISFRRLTEEEIKGFILGKGNYSNEDIELVSHLSNGSLSRAVELLDENRKIEREILKMILIKNDYEKLKETFDKEKLVRFIDFLIPFLRDVRIVETGQKLLCVDIEGFTHSIHKRYSNGELNETFELLRNSLTNISRNINPELISNVVFDRLKGD